MTGALRSASRRLLLLGVAWQGLSAQSADPARTPQPDTSLQVRIVIVRGRVLDGADRPVAAAAIEQIGGVARTRTDGDGRFELPLARDARARDPASLAARIVVRRQGYRAAVLDISWAAVDRGAPLIVRLTSLAAEIDRVVVLGARERALGTSMTRQDIARAPALVEPDVMRQATLTPSVMQTNSAMARVHLAGAAIDEALYTLDGHPLQAPTHVRGIGSGIATAALDRVEVISHHLPATMDGRAGGVIAMHSRRARDVRDGEVLASSLALTAAHAEPDILGAEVVVAGRTSYLDGKLAGVDEDWLDEQFPLNDFRDGLIRISRGVAGWKADLLGFLSTDLHLADSEPDDPFRGEYLVGLTLSRGDSSSRTTIRASRNLATRASGWRDVSPYLRSRQVFATGSVEHERRVDLRTRAALRVALTGRRNAHEWQEPLQPVARELVPFGTPFRFDGVTSLALVSGGALVERRMRSDLTGELGLALDGTRAGLFAAPRAHVAWRPRPALQVEFSLERRHQFDGEMSPELIVDLASPVFLYGRPRRLDAAALTASWRRDWTAWRFSVNADLYARHIRDRPTTAGVRFTAEEIDTLAVGRLEAFAAGSGIAAVLVGPRDASLSLTYGLSKAMDRDPDGWVSSSWDRPHSLTFVGTTPRIAGISIGTTVRHVSGIRATPVLAVIPTSNLLPQFPLPRILFGERNAAALPATTRVDIGLRHAWRIGRLEGELMAQSYNVTGTRIPMVLEWTGFGGESSGNVSYELNWSEVERLHSFGVAVRW